MMAERQEQIENGIEVLNHAEDHLRTKVSLPNYRPLDSVYRIKACELIANLQLELAIEWDQIEEEKRKR